MPYFVAGSSNSWNCEALWCPVIVQWYLSCFTQISRTRCFTYLSNYRQRFLGSNVEKGDKYRSFDTVTSVCIGPFLNQSQLNCSIIDKQYSLRKKCCFFIMGKNFYWTFALKTKHCGSPYNHVRLQQGELLRTLKNALNSFLS